MISTKTGFGSDTYIIFIKNRIGLDRKKTLSDHLCSPFAHFPCSTALFRRDVSANLCSNFSDALVSVFYSPVLTRCLIFLQLWTALS